MTVCNQSHKNGRINRHEEEHRWFSWECWLVVENTFSKRNYVFSIKISEILILSVYFRNKLCVSRIRVIFYKIRCILLLDMTDKILVYKLTIFLWNQVGQPFSNFYVSIMRYFDVKGTTDTYFNAIIRWKSLSSYDILNAFDFFSILIWFKASAKYVVSQVRFSLTLISYNLDAIN